MRTNRRSTRPSLEILDNRMLLSNFYVAPGGSRSGNGSLNQPWDLQTGLSQPAAVHPGDVIWVRGGTYLGNFQSTLSGTANSPIVVREYPGERATLDGNVTPTSATLTVNGQYTWFYDLEITDSSTTRVVNYSGSNGPRGDGVDNYAVGTKLIDLVVHDCGNGIGDWAVRPNGSPSNTEVYGCIIYENGWVGTDRAHGHAFYVQNQNGTQAITDNIAFNSFDVNLQNYGSSAAYLNNMTLTGNDFFNSGAMGGYSTYAFLVGGGSVAQNPTLVNNSVYDDTGGTALSMGYESGATGVSLTNNYFSSSSGTAILSKSSTYTTVSGNLFNGTISQSGGSQNFITGNTYLPAGTKPTQNQVFVRPNTYEPGRANITVFNWQHLQAVSVDVSSAGLKVGQAFEVVDTQNFFGGPIVTGVYTGGTISLPMTGTAVAQPVGNVPFPAVHTGIGYGSFVLLPVTTNLAGTTTALTSSLSPSAYGQAVTFTATVAPVSPGAGVPTGTVTFMDGTTSIGTGTLNSSGVATLSTSSLSGATHSITAVYSGDTNFSGNTSTSMNQVVNPAASSTTSIWGSTAKPANPSENDSSAVELGVKFYSDVSGYITGLKFYKGSTNTGTHVADLWTSSGKLLATATFTSETGSGWQQVNFATPVAITAGAGTTYVASYHTNVGHYANDQNYFTSQYNSGSLHVPANGGVYAYGGAGSFPTRAWNASNYWVDIVLSPGTGNSIATPATAKLNDSVLIAVAPSSDASSQTVKGVGSIQPGGLAVPGSGSASATTKVQGQSLLGQWVPGVVGRLNPVAQSALVKAINRRFMSLGGSGIS